MWLASVGKDGTYYWVKPQIDRRNNDINELVGTAKFQERFLLL